MRAVDANTLVRVITRDEPRQLTSGLTSLSLQDPDLVAAALENYRATPPLGYPPPTRFPQFRA